jgi:diguanylate cyclase (GGDEF)-like protein/PAS domain S-box-containing protein
MRAPWAFRTLGTARPGRRWLPGVAILDTGTPPIASAPAADHRNVSTLGLRDLRSRLSDVVLYGTIVGGLIVVALSAIELLETGAWWSVLPFAVLAIVTDFLGVDLIDSQHERLNFSFSIAVLTCAAAMNPLVAPLIGLVDGAAHTARIKNRRLDKVLFNLGNSPLSTGAASACYLVMRPVLGDSALGELAIGLVAAIAFFITNSVGVSLMISLKLQRPFVEVLRASSWAVPINILLGLTGAFVGGGYGQLGAIGTGMFIVPLGVLRVTLVIFARKSRYAINALQTLNDQLSDEVAQRSAAELALGKSEAHLRAVLDNVAEGILTVDEYGCIESCNPAGEQVFGFPATALAGRPLGELVPMLCITSPTEGVSFGQMLSFTKLGNGPMETSGRRSDESIFPIEVAIGDMARGATRFVVSVRDITERKQAQAALEHQAVHDALTGLPNRVLLHDRLSQGILLARRDSMHLALLVMDLDRFKDVNDTLGHHYGDLLLREVGVRIRSVLRESDTAARLGGDEFAVLLPRATAEDAELAARRLLEALSLPFTIDGHPVDIGASIGVALFPEHGSDPGTLLRRADVAMYVAKRSQSELAFYSPEQDQHSPDRLTLVAELRTGIEQDQLELFYQPKADLRSGYITSAEALVRWRHPQRGLVPPDEFIPLAEQSGQVRALSRWVLNAALKQARAWQDMGRSLVVCVNLSMRDLQDPGLPELVGSLLSAWGVPPSLLGLEITESTLMADPAQAMDIVRRLSAMGVSVAIDDFGTGYSSLAYLKRLAVHELKVDRSFVRHVASDAHDVAIVRSTISLAHELGLAVVAEGIEDQATWHLLSRLGCDTAQGYWISRPLPVEKFEEWVRDSGWRLASDADGNVLPLVA